MFGLTEDAGERELPTDAVAEVASQHISDTGYQRAVAAVNADRRTLLNAGGSRNVQDLRIDEAVLIQYGLDPNFGWQAPQFRDLLMAAVLSGIRAQADALEFDQNQVQAFYGRHAALFRGPDLLQVALIFSNTREHADAVRAAMDSGDDWCGGQLKSWTVY